MFRHAARHRIAALLLVAALVGALAIACFTPRQVSREDFLAGNYPKNEHLRLIYETGSVLLKEDWTLDYPFVEGVVDRSTGTPPLEQIEGQPKRVRLNIEDARTIEIFQFSRTKTGFAIGVPVGAVTAATIFILVLVTAMTAWSCPTVYLYTGPVVEIVGAIHPGSVFQRAPSADYLALPRFQGNSMLEIVNAHHEIEHLDALAVASIEHPPDSRVVMAGDRLVVVGQAHPADISVRGADARSIAAADGVVFQATISDDELEDRIEVRFRAREQAAVALIVTAENTRWFEFVTQAYLAEHHGALPELDSVALRVTANGAARIFVAPFGADGFRTVGVPLGTFREGDDCMVTLAAPRAFWRFDAIGVARILDAHPRITWHRLEAVTASRSASRAMIEQADGKTLLMQPGDRIQLRLRSIDCMTASCFVWTFGSYEVIPSLPDSVLARFDTDRAMTFDSLHAALARQSAPILNRGHSP